MGETVQVNCSYLIQYTFFQSPPSSYSFELLAIYLWQQDGKPQTFKIENGLRRVMEQLADYQSIKVEFFEYYNHNMHQR